MPDSFLLFLDMKPKATCMVGIIPRHAHVYVYIYMHMYMYKNLIHVLLLNKICIAQNLHCYFLITLA